MAQLKNMIKEEPELCIMDDPYVSKLCSWQINSVHCSTEPVEETVQNSTTDVPGEKETLNPPKRKGHRKHQFRGFYSKCSVCGKTFEKVLPYEVHMSKVHNIKPYECSICSRKFSRKSYLAPHVSIAANVHILVNIVQLHLAEHLTSKNTIVRTRASNCSNVNCAISDSQGHTA